MSSSTYVASIDRGLTNSAQPWLWVNLLSLDAPIVALLWQALFSQVFGANLRWPAFVALGTSVWIIYVGDRLLDARNTSASQAALRHDFCRQHHQTFRVALVIGLLLLGGALSFLNRLVLRNGLVTSALVGLYLAAVHTNSQTLRRYFPKEVVVGLIFAIGTCLATWSRMQASGRVLLPAVFFAGLCWLNCRAIELWEAQGSNAELNSRFELSLLTLTIGSAILVPLAGAQTIFASVVFGAILLLAIHRSREKISTDAARVLADVCLCTPALFLIHKAFK